MPSALSSPSPAARISRAKSTPPRPMKCWAVIMPWNSFMTWSTSASSTEPSRISSRVSDSTSRGRSLASRTPASSLLLWARKTAALRRPGSSGRGGSGTAGRAAPPPRPTRASTDAMLMLVPRWLSWFRSCRLVLAQPAAQHRRDLVRLLADHRRDVGAHLLAFGGLEFHLPRVDLGLLAAAGHPQAVELGEHVVGEL